MKLFIMCCLFVNLFGSTTISNEFNYYIANMKKTKLHTSNYGNIINYFSLESTIKLHTSNMSVIATPYIYTYSTSNDSAVKNSNFDNKFYESDFFLRSLYVTIDNKFTTYGVGLIPTSNSFPMEYTRDYYSDGEGLSILTDSNALAIFMKTKNDNQSLMVAIASTDHNIPTGQHTPATIKDSNGGFIVHKINNQKIKIISELVYENIKYEHINYGNLLLFGVGTVYDDSDNTGISIYNTIGFSRFDSSASNVKNKMLYNNGMNQNTIDLYPDNFDFENKIIYGASHLLGIRKDFDGFNHEMFINFEWFHTFNDWISGNMGNPYNSNCTQIYNIRNDSYFLNYGIRIDNKSFLSLNYSYLEFKELPKIGNPTSINTSDSIRPQRTNATILKLNYKYRF